MTSTKNVNRYCSRILHTIRVLLKDTLVPSKSAQLCIPKLQPVPYRAVYVINYKRTTSFPQRKIMEEVNSLLNGYSYVSI